MKLIKIKIEEFTLIPPETQFTGTDIGVFLSNFVGLNPEQENISFGMGATYKIQGNEVLRCRVVLTFHDADYEKIIQIKDEQVTFNGDVLPSIINVSIGTLRGVIADRVIGTALEDYPLPLFNPDEVVKHIATKKMDGSQA